MTLNRFKLRIPTTKDWEQIQNHISCVQKSCLHWNPKQLPGHEVQFKEFILTEDRKKIVAGQFLKNLSYSYHIDEDIHLSFRPLLESEEKLFCIKDGTKISMGHFKTGPYDADYLEVPGPNDTPPPWPGSDGQNNSMLSLFPFPTPGIQEISWVKFGSFLIADRPLISNMHFQYLKELGLVDGISLQMPFDETVSKYFFAQLSTQPDSPQRHVGHIMWELFQELKYRRQPRRLNPDELYHLALSVRTVWLHGDLSLDEIIQHTANLFHLGLSNFVWKEDGQYYSKNYPSPVIQHILLDMQHPRYQDVFQTLVLCAAEEEIDVVSLRDQHGHPTKCGITLERLKQAEETLFKESPSLDTLLHGAQPISSRKTTIGPVPDRDNSR